MGIKIRATQNGKLLENMPLLSLFTPASTPKPGDIVGAEICTQVEGSQFRLFPVTNVKKRFFLPTEVYVDFPSGLPMDGYEMQEAIRRRNYDSHAQA